MEEKNIESSESEEVQEIPPQIDLRVSSDNLSVYVKVQLSNPMQNVSVEEIINTLTNAGIKHGIDEDAIKHFCENRMFYTDVDAAKGVPSVDGQNGTIKYNFKTDTAINLIESENGRVNFKELGLVQNVKKGDVLCYAVPPINGVDGINVFGEVIHFKKGIPATLYNGQNTLINEDGNQITAEIDGCVELKSQQVIVNDVYTIKGDVDNGVGNIESAGSVLVQGDVREGFTIKAAKDVTVRGIVEGATIIAGGNINISSGMNGMHRGRLTAQGNIVSKYIENATINCKGDLYADVLLNSNIVAGGSVILRGSRASVIGGSCQAGVMVYANYIGSYKNIPTSIIIDSPDARKSMNSDSSTAQAKVDDLSAKVNVKNLKITELQAEIKTLSRALKDPEAKKELRNAMLQKNEVAAEISKFEAELNKAKELLNKPSVYKIMALKTAYRGVKITIGYLFMTLEEDYSYTKFCVTGHNLGGNQIQPTDKV